MFENEIPWDFVMQKWGRCHCLRHKPQKKNIDDIKLKMGYHRLKSGCTSRKELEDSL